MVTQPARHSKTPLLLDRMWVRELSHAQPCSKTVLFITTVTLLCNAAVCMCTVGGGEGRQEGAGFLLTSRAPVCALLVFVSAEASRRHRGALLPTKGQRAGSKGVINTSLYARHLCFLSFQLLTNNNIHP